MKLIDTHTHFFPDSIARQSIAALSKEDKFEACGDGTVAALRQFMKKDKVSLSVNLPVATKKEQVQGINRKMIEFNAGSPGDVICFGAMHPEYQKAGNVREELHFLVENGIKGIKLHPEYQQFYPDDPGMCEMYEVCAELGLIIAFHAGFDFPYPDHIRSTPERLKEVTKIAGLKLIFAHLGGYRMWDGVLKYLAGTSAYFDTAFIEGIERAVLLEIIEKHGDDKIVFGTDFPWARAETIRKIIDDAVPCPETKNKIFCKNAERLLGLT
jgi:predicted TIM-barrel fold metal-dependent hydrolase